MSKNKNFSVVITTYNRNLKLLNSIRSVLNQKYKAKEIIVINNYPKKITKKELGFKKLKILKIFNLKKNLQAAGGRNFGATKISYEYIAFLDDDDEWDRNYLNHANKIIKKDKSDVVLTNLYFINSKNKLLKKVENLNIQDCFIKNPGCMGSNLIINKKNFFEVNGFNKKYVPAEDRELLIRMLKKKYKFSISNSRVYYDPSSENSISKNYDLILTGHSNLLNNYRSYINFENIMFMNFKLSKIKFFKEKNLLFKIIRLAITLTYFITHQILK